MAKKSFLETLYGTGVSEEEVSKIKKDILQEELSKAPETSTGEHFGFAKIGSLDPRYSKYSDSISGFTPDPEAVADKLQGSEELWRASVKGFGINLLAGALDSFGSNDPRGLTNMAFGRAEGDYGNELNRQAQKIREWGQKVAPIYNANPENMWSENYWATQISNLGTSAGIMVTGLAEQALLGLATGGVGNVASIGKYAKIATLLSKMKIPATAKAIRNTGQFTFGMYQGIKEAHMNGMENYHNVYNDYVNKGRSEQEAESAAKEASTKSFRYEVGPSLLLNGLQWMSWGSQYNPYNKGRMGSGVSDAASSVFEKMVPKTAGKGWKVGADILGNTLSEGMEEGFQSAAQSIGQYQTDKRRGYVEEGETLGTYMFNHEFRDEVVGGMLGGLFFMGFGKVQSLVNNSLKDNRAEKDQQFFMATTAERAHKKLKQLAELERTGQHDKAEVLRAQMGYDNIEASLMYDYLNSDGDFKTFNSQVEQLKEIQEAIEKGDEEKLEILGLQDQADENGVNLYRRLKDNIGDMIIEAEMQKADMIENLTMQDRLLGEEDYTIAQIKTKNQHTIRTNNSSAQQAQEYIDKINLDSTNSRNDLEIEYRNLMAEHIAFNSTSVTLNTSAKERKIEVEERIQEIEDGYSKDNNLAFDEKGSVEKQLTNAYSVIKNSQISNHNLSEENNRLSSLKGMKNHVDNQIKEQIEEHETTTDVRKLENILGAISNNPRARNLYSPEQLKTMESSIKEKIKIEKAKTKEQKQQEAKATAEAAIQRIKEREEAKKTSKEKEELRKKGASPIVKDPKDNTTEEVVNEVVEQGDFQVGDEITYIEGGKEVTGKITGTNRVKRSGIYQIGDTTVHKDNVKGLVEQTQEQEVIPTEKIEVQKAGETEQQKIDRLERELEESKKIIDDNRKGSEIIPGAAAIVSKAGKVSKQDDNFFFNDDDSSIQITEIEGAEDMAPSPINPNNTEIKNQLKSVAEQFLKSKSDGTLKDFINSFLNSEGVSAQGVDDAFYYISNAYYEAKGESFEANKAEVERVYNETIQPFNIVNVLNNTLNTIAKDKQEAKENQKEFQDNKEEILNESNQEVQKEIVKEKGPIIRITRDGKVVRYEGPKTAAASVNVPFNGIPYIASMKLVNGVPHYTYLRDSQEEENLLRADTSEARKRAFMMNPALTKVGTEMRVYLPTLSQLENDDTIVVPIWTKNDKGFLEKTLVPFNEWMNTPEYTQEVNAVGEPIGEKTLVDKSPGSQRFLEKVPVYMNMKLGGQETNMSSAIHDVEWWNERNVADFMNSDEYNAVLEEYDVYNRGSKTALDRAAERARGLQQMVIEEGRATTLEIRERIWEETQANREGWENKERGVVTEIPMEITAVTPGPTNQLDRDAPKKNIQESAHKDLMVGIVVRGERGLEFAYTSKNGSYSILPPVLLHNPGILKSTAKLGYTLTAIPFKPNENGDMTYLLQMVDNGYSAAQPKLAALYKTRNEIEQTYYKYRNENTKDANSEESKRLRAKLKDVFDKTGTKNYESVLREPPKDGKFLFDNVLRHYPMTGTNKRDPSQVHYQVAINKDNLSGDMANILYFDKDGNAQIYKPFPESSDSSYVQMVKENVYTNHSYAEIRDLSVADPKSPNATKFVADVQPRVHIDFSGNEISKRTIEKKVEELKEEQKKNDIKKEEVKEPVLEEVIELTQGQRYTILNNIFNNLLGKFVTDKVSKRSLSQEMRTILEESISALKETNPSLYDAILKEKDSIIGLGRYKNDSYTLREIVQAHFNIENFQELDEDFLDAESTLEKNYSKIAQEHDVRTSISSKLKRLFSGIPTNKKRGEAVGDIVEFMELDDVFSAVQDILADSSNDFESFRFQVEEKMKLNPEEFGFLEIVLEKLLNTADDQLQREVLFKLNQSKNRMFFIYSKSEKNGYTLKVLDANSRNPLVNAKSQAREQFKLSSLIENLGDGEYRLVTSKIEIIQQEIMENLKSLKAGNPNYQSLSRILSEFGVYTQASTLEAMNKLDPASESYAGPIGDLMSQLFRNTYSLTTSEKNLSREGIKLNFGNPSLNLLLHENNNYLNNFLGELIKVTFNIDQSMSVAGKTINAFSQPNFFTEQVRKLIYLEGKDLAEGSEHLAKKLLDNGFSKNSMLLQLITEIDPMTKALNPRAKAILEELFVGYSSLDVLKRKESKSEEQGLSELSSYDYDTAIMGYFGDMSKKVSGVWNGIPLRMSMMTSPTLSDSSQMFLLNSVVLDLDNNHLQVGANGRINGYNDSVAEILYQQLLLPEITRILEVQGTTRDTIENQMIYSIPAVNAIEDAQGVSLLHFLQANRVSEGLPIETILFQLKEKFGTQIDEIVKEVITESVNKKLSVSEQGDLSGSWVDAGFITQTKTGTTSAILDSNFLKKKFESGSNLGRTEVAAWDFTINYFLSQAQTQMLFNADFANYSKVRDSDFNDGNITNPKTVGDTQQQRADVYINIARATSENLSKRLKAQISPGNRIAFSQGKKYLQLALNDSIEVSTQFENYIKSWYESTITEEDLARVDSLLKYAEKLKAHESLLNPTEIDKQAYEDNRISANLLTNYLKSKYPAIAGYLENAATDAQEYTTWKEHLDVSRDMGKLSKKEYDTIKGKLEQQSKGIFNDETTLDNVEKAIFQPMKPLHSGMYFRNMKDTDGNETGKTYQEFVYVKSSSFALIPEMTRGLGLDNLRKNMESLQETQSMPVRASYQTANKVGSILSPMNVNQLMNNNEVEFSDDNFAILDRENFSIQQEKPFKTDKNIEEGVRDEVGRGTQIEKILLGNGINKIENQIFPNLFNESLLTELEIVPSEDNNISGKDLYKIYTELASREQEIKSKSFLRKLGVDPKDFQLGSINSMRKLQSALSTRLPNKQDQEILDLKYFIKDSNGVGRYITESQLEANPNLEPVSAEFSFPIWLSPNSRKFESVLNSMITNEFIKLKLPGNSFPVASEIGFTKNKKLGELTESERSAIVFSKNFNGTKLLPEKTIDGVTYPAQVLIASKFRSKEVVDGKVVEKLIDFTEKDSNGKYIYLNEEGQINFDMISPEALQLFSFRIPTSAHQSGAIVEIVGFLPHSVGDLMVVPNEHTTKIGEDYDIDTRYTYSGNYIMGENGKIEFLKREHIPTFPQEKLDNLYAQFEEFKDILFQDIKSRFENNTRKENEISSEIATTDFLIKVLENKKNPLTEESEEIIALKEELEDLKASLNKDWEGFLEDFRAERDVLYNNFIENRDFTIQEYQAAKRAIGNELNVIENEIVNLFKSVYTSADNDIQKLITTTINTNMAQNTAKLMDAKINFEQGQETFSIYDFDHQKSIMRLGSSGKLGIGVHSNWVVWNGLVQQSEQIIKLDDMNMRIGNFVSDGTLGNIEALSPVQDYIKGNKLYSNFKSRFVSEINMENQNSSTDNQKLQIMGKRNENKFTINVFALMNNLGFDKDVVKVKGEPQELLLSSLFINQPILRRYVELREKYASAFTEFTSDVEAAITQQLAEEFGSNVKFVVDEETGLKTTFISKKDYNIASAKMTGQHLFDSLVNPVDATVQWLVFDKFLEFQSHATNVNKVIQMMNIDKGLGVSYFNVLGKKNILMSEMNFTKLGIQNVETLFGEAPQTQLKDDGSQEFLDLQAQYIKDGFIKIGQNEDGIIFIRKPNSPNSAKLLNSISMAYHLWGNIFPFENKYFAQQIEDVLNATRPIVEENDYNTKAMEIRYEALVAIRDYMYSFKNIPIFSDSEGNINTERRRLLIDDKTNNKESLASYIVRLKKELASNPEILNEHPSLREVLNKAFFRNLEFEINEKSPSLIKYSINNTNSFNKNLPHTEIGMMSESQETLPAFDGDENYTHEKLIKDLVKYSLLTNVENGAIGFRNFIPMSVFKKYGIDSKLTAMSNMEIGGGRFFNILYNGTLKAVTSFIGDDIVYSSERGEYLMVPGNIIANPVHLNSLGKILSNVNRTLGEGTLEFNLEDGNIYINRPQSQIDKSRFVRQFYQHNSELATKVQFKDAGISNRNLVAEKMYVGVTFKDSLKGEFSAPQFITIRGANNESFLFELNQSATVGSGATFRYRKINKLGGFGVNEYNPNGEVKESLFQKNNVSQEQEVFAIRTLDDKTNVFNLPKLNETPSGLTIEQTLNLFKEKIGETTNEETNSLINTIEELLEFTDIDTRVFDAKLTGGSASYNRADNLIKLDSRQFNEGNINDYFRVFAEEVIHSLTSREIETYINGSASSVSVVGGEVRVNLVRNNPGLPMPAPITKLVQLYKKGVESLIQTRIETSATPITMDQALKEILALKPTEDSSGYRIQNLKEFVAGVFSDASFREKMNAVQYRETDKSILQNFAELIGRILKTISNTISDQTIATTMDIISSLQEIAPVRRAPISQQTMQETNQRAAELLNQTSRVRKKSKGKIKIENTILHSGGALGSDSVWGNIGKQFGLKEKNTNHYYHSEKTPLGNKEISTEDYQEGRLESAKAAKRNWGYQYSAMKDARLIRNWSQVKHADSVFAIGEIAAIGEKVFPNQSSDTRTAITPSVKGGTGYAIGMAINHNKPAYIFQQTDSENYPKGWYLWSNSAQDFVRVNTPTLTQNFAGIGTRQINAAGENAIREVYEKTFREDNIQEDSSIDINESGTDPDGDTLTGRTNDFAPSTSNYNGISDVFESNPELATIGSKIQYSQYLDTIFPDSKEDRILVHASHTTNIEKFEKTPNKNFLGFAQLGKGLYLTDLYNLDYWRHELELKNGEGKNYYVKVNLQNTVGVNNFLTKEKEESLSENIDAVYENRKPHEKENNWKPDQYAVRNPEQIHILGSKRDMQGFRDFVQEGKTIENIKPGVSELFESNPELANEVYEALGFNFRYTSEKWKNDPTKENKATYINIKGTPSNQEFQVKKDIEEGFYSIHFKTEQGKLTKEQIQTLVDAIASQIPIGGKLSTWGEITKGGIFGLNRFLNNGFEKVGEREIKDREGNPIIIPILEKVKKSNLEQQAQQQYSQYLDTIFPDSKVKDIYQHSSNVDLQNEGFKKGFGKTSDAFFFDKFGTSEYSGKYNVKALLNVINTFHRYGDSANEYLKAKYGKNVIQDIREGMSLEMQGYIDNVSNKDAKREYLSLDAEEHPDSESSQFIKRNTIDELQKYGNFDSINAQGYLAVFEPSQIHILGSKRDIKGFKEFVGNENNALREVAFSPDFFSFTELKQDIFKNCK